MSKPSNRNYHWCFTSYKDNIVYNERYMLYLVYGVESCPTTKRVHLQGFVALKGRATRGRAKIILNDAAAHLEVRRGTVEQAISYCKKDGVIFEWGSPPVSGSEATKGLFRKADSLAKRGDFDSIDSSIRIRCYGNLQRIRQSVILSQKHDVLLPGSVCGMWLQGKPGTGKSFYARQFCTERELQFFYKALNKWWDGYQFEPIVIIEDLDHFHAPHMGSNLKIWADEAPFIAELKGGSTKIRPRLIIVTSNYPIAGLWQDPDLIEAISRRFFQPVITCREDFERITCPQNLSIILNGIQTQVQGPSSIQTPSQETICSSP